MSGEHINVLGSVISVELPDADRARVRAQWACCLAPSGAAPVSSVEYGMQDDPDRRDYALASSLTLAGIRHAAGSRLMLHAAGVADPATGRVAVLVAASGTGKTTAAHRLCSNGFGYVTDETVSIDADGAVLPYPKPLSVVIDGDSPHHKSQHSPRELGLAPCPPDPHAALFVLLDRDRDNREPVPPTLEQVPLLDGLLELIPQTSALPAMAHPLRSLVHAVRRAGGVWRLRYREITDAADLLRTALQAQDADPSDIVELPSDDPSRGPSHPVGPGPTATSEDQTSTDSPRGTDPLLTGTTSVARAPYLDAVGIDDEVLVLIDRRPARLTGLGTTAWLHSDVPATIAQLTQRCVAEHGTHPQAEQLVRDAVGELLRHGVLQRV